MRADRWAWIGCLWAAWAAGCEGLPATIAVATSREVGVVPQSAAIQGHDGGSSALLFGHSVWMYGDTVLGMNDAAGINWHGNSFAFTDDLDASDGIGGFGERLDTAGAPVPLLANTDEEAAFNAAHYGEACAEQPCGARWALWPGAAVWDAARGRGLIWYGLIHAEPGDFNFFGAGQSLATWSDFARLPERPVVTPGAEHPTMLFGKDEPGYGAAAVIGNDGDGELLYSFACDSSGLSRPCTVARVPADRALERAAWTFWDGAAWSATVGSAHSVFDGGLGLSVLRWGDSWLAVYAASLGNQVKARTAPALTGPWSDEIDVFEADRKGDSGWTYDAYVHPEMSPAGGKVLFITYTRSNHQGWFGSETVLVRVELR